MIRLEGNFSVKSEIASSDGLAGAFRNFDRERMIDRLAGFPGQAGEALGFAESPALRLPARPGSPQSDRIRRTLEDNLATSRARLENWMKARDNHQLVELEIDQRHRRLVYLVQSLGHPVGVHKEIDEEALPGLRDP